MQGTTPRHGSARRSRRGIAIAAALSVAFAGSAAPIVAQDAADPYIGKNLEEMEKIHILNTLDMVGGNRSKAAKLLGIDASTLWRKLQ